jgi:hypothetical protein
MTNRRLSRCAAPILATALLSLAACSDDPLTIEGLAGQYVMTAAEGQALPATVSTSDTLEIEVTGGTLLLLANAQYSLDVDFRLVDPQMPGATATETFIDVGPWDISGDFLALQSTTPGRTWVASVDGSRIILEIGEPDFLERPIELTFRREAS